MPKDKTPGKPTTRRYRQAEKDGAVRAARQLRKELGTEHGTVQRVADQLGYVDNALAETTNGLYKTECVFGPDAPRPWDDVDELELATLSQVHWFNHEWLRSYCGHVPPAEIEAAFYAAQQTDPAGVGNQ